MCKSELCDVDPNHWDVARIWPTQVKHCSASPTLGEFGPDFAGIGQVLPELGPIAQIWLTLGQSWRNAGQSPAVVGQLRAKFGWMRANFGRLRANVCRPRANFGRLRPTCCCFLWLVAVQIGPSFVDFGQACSRIRAKVGQHRLKMGGTWLHFLLKLAETGFFSWVFGNLWTIVSRIRPPQFSEPSVFAQFRDACSLYSGSLGTRLLKH